MPHTRQSTKTPKIVHWHPCGITKVKEIPIKKSASFIRGGKALKPPASKIRKANLKSAVPYSIPAYQVPPIPPPPPFMEGDMFLPRKHKYKLYYNGEIVSKAMIYGPFMEFENTNLDDEWDFILKLELPPLETKAMGKFWDLSHYIQEGWFKFVK